MRDLEAKLTVWPSQFARFAWLTFLLSGADIGGQQKLQGAVMRYGAGAVVLARGLAVVREFATPEVRWHQGLLLWKQQRRGPDLFQLARRA